MIYRYLPFAAAVFIVFATQSPIEAVEILTQRAMPVLNQSAVDELNGRVGVMSAPLHVTSWGGASNAAAFTDAATAISPGRNVFWNPDGEQYHITWDLGTAVPPHERQLDTVSIWIDAHDPGRKGYRGSLSISIDNTEFTEIPGTYYSDELVQSGTGTNPHLNNVTYALAPREVVGFRYLRFTSDDDAAANQLQPRYIEVDAFASRVPGPSSRPDFWSIRDGRFHVDDQWVFLKTGKLLRNFGSTAGTAAIIADIDVMIDRLDYNHVSLNIYADQFDRAADGRVDPDREAAFDALKGIIDHCWARGIFVSLSFETYNVGGGGVPSKLFQAYPEIHAKNALLEVARDVEYGGANGKFIPSIHHPRYLKWSRDFIRNFLLGIGSDRASKLLYVETTVEPQYLGRNNVDSDQRRAALDFSEAARDAFERWKAALPAGDAGRNLSWPSSQQARDAAIGHTGFDRFRGQALGAWVSGDIAAIRSVIPDVFIAVDYNGRFDDPQNLRVGHVDSFLAAINGANVIQVAPHWSAVWTDKSWDDVDRVNTVEGKGWAVSEHMTANGGFPPGDSTVSSILDNTLSRGTRWGWEFVNVANNHPADIFHLYRPDWTSPVLHVIEAENWEAWLAKIGVERFIPYRQNLAAYFEIWRGHSFTESQREDDAISGPLADPSGQGTPNLMRYSMGIDVEGPIRGALPAARIRTLHLDGEDASYLVLTFRRNRMARDLAWLVEASGDLITWSPLPPENLVERVIDGEIEEMTYRDNDPVGSGGTKRFLRLAVYDK